MRTKFLFPLLLLIASQANSEIVAGVHTAHFHGNDFFNNDTELVAWRQGGNIFGTMVNSYHTRSFFYARDWRPTRYIGAFFGAATGYCSNSDYESGTEHCPLGVRPVIAPYFEFGLTDSARVNIVSFGTSITTTIGIDL